MGNPALLHRIAELSLSALKNSQDETVESFCRLGLMLDPDAGTFYHHLGLSALIRDDVTTALPHLNTAIEKFGNDTAASAKAAYRDLIVAHLMQQDYDAALPLARKASATWQDDAALEHLAAQAAEGSGDSDLAASFYEKALTANPSDPTDRASIAFALGTLRYQQRRLADAYSAFRQAIDANPHHTKSWNNLGNVLSDMGRPAEAFKAYESALRIDPHYTNAHSNLLQTLHYLPDQTASSLMDAHRAWAKQHIRRETPLPAKPKNRNKLCVGLVSEDLRQHPVGYFCKGWLPHAAEAGLEVIVYCSNRHSDDVTYEMKPHAAHWQYVDEKTDAQLTRCIREDAPDILLDLAGHTGRNRLGVFANRPVPCQATWMGYVGTTGLPQMDGLIADKVHVPKLEVTSYVEEIWRMPNGYVCFDPPQRTPQTRDKAWKHNGHIRFAAFHNPAKINAQLIAAWAKILNEVKDSEICFAYRGYEEPIVQELISRTFQAHGIAPTRLDFRGAVPHHDLLELYNDCDFALDSFPYSGGLTTLEAMWMGIPVITTPGRTFASRHSASHLTHGGFAQDVTTNVSEYIRTAVAWAHSPLMRDADRKARRARFAASPLCDGKTFALDLANLLKIKSDWKQ